MRRKHFHVLHSIAATALLLVVQGALVVTIGSRTLDQYLVVAIALLGGAGIIFVAMEAIEEVRNARHMLVLLSAVAFEFIVFFAFQYWYFSLVAPGTFQGLTLDPVTLLLHSTMVFAFNPLYLSSSVSGRALMLVNTLESMALVIFVLQNVWQFRAPKQDDS
jgi:hypothetical protein